MWADEVHGSRSHLDEAVPRQLKLKKRNVHEEEDVPNKKEKNA